MNFKKLISLFAVVLFLGSGSIFAMQTRSGGESKGLTPKEEEEVSALTADIFANEDGSNDGSGDEEEIKVHDGRIAAARRALFGFRNKLWGSAKKILHHKYVTTPASLFFPTTPIKRGEVAFAQAIEALKLLKTKEFKQSAGKAVISASNASMAILSTIAMVYGVDSAMLLAGEVGFSLEMFGYTFGTISSAAYDNCVKFIQAGTPALWAVFNGMFTDGQEVGEESTE